MRLFWSCMVCGILAWGCARHKPAPPSIGMTAPPPPVITTRSQVGAASNASLIVTPGQQMTGRLASVNPASRFVIVTFPLGTMPQVDKRMSVYRNGLKVGEIKITGPQRDINIAADIIGGNCQVGDEVKNDQ